MNDSDKTIMKSHKF